jgi:hypothetical protein
MNAFRYCKIVVYIRAISATVCYNQKHFNRPLCVPLRRLRRKRLFFNCSPQLLLLLLVDEATYVFISS